MLTPDNTLQVLLIIVTSYLIGSIPTAYLVGKIKRIDIFEVGSGNMGGTNVARAVGKGWALFTVLADAGKGIFAVLLARDVILTEQLGLATSVAATAVVVGHNWSFFATLLSLSFVEGRLNLVIRGGKGAATAFGTMLMIQPFQSVVAAVIAIYIISRTRYVSLGVLIGFLVANIWLVVLVGEELQETTILLYVVALSMMLVLRFRGNIQRLLSGTERRFGENATA